MFIVTSRNKSSICSAIVVILLIFHIKMIKTNERLGESEEEDQIDVPIQEDIEEISTSSIINEENKTRFDRYQSYYDELFTFNKRIESSRDLYKLRRSLLFGYDRFSRPLINSSDAVVVKLGVNVAQINGLDEDYQVNKTFGTVRPYRSLYLNSKVQVITIALKLKKEFACISYNK